MLRRRPAAPPRVTIEIGAFTVRITDISTVVVMPTPGGIGEQHDVVVTVRSGPSIHETYPWKRAAEARRDMIVEAMEAAGNSKR